MTDSSMEKLETKIQTLEKELEAQKKITKNALKFSVGVSIVCFFFIVLNLSIYFTIAGGVAGNERKVQSVQTEIENLKIKYKRILLNEN